MTARWRHSVSDAKRAVAARIAVARERRLPRGASTSVDKYWTRHNVTGHQRFATRDESLSAFHWRSSIYHGYLDLMPVNDADGLVVLDFGCGPGHDLVGFGHFSRPSRLIGMDVSPTSLDEARDRLALHRIEADLVHLNGASIAVPLEDDSVDLIHSSGVLHHVSDPVGVLREFQRVLRPGGEIRLMAYNWASLWVHLYVAYVIRIRQRMYREMTVRAAFQRTTDGPQVPIAQVWNADEVAAMAASAGFDATFTGSSVSMLEMNQLAARFDAIADPSLEDEHRSFLTELRFDDGGWPLAPSGHRAGVGGCYRLRARPGGA